MLPQHHQNQLNIGQVLPTTNAEGPGLRYALWVQGCSLRCPGPFESVTSLAQRMDSAF